MTEEELKQELKEEFWRIWLDSDLDDWTYAPMRDLHILYHSVFTKGENE